MSLFSATLKRDQYSGYTHPSETLSSLLLGRAPPPRRDSCVLCVTHHSVSFSLEALKGRKDTMSEPTLSWRELLAQIIRAPVERDRIANEIGVRSITLLTCLLWKAKQRLRNFH